MKYLFIKKYWWLLSIVILLMIMTAIFSSAASLLTSLSIDFFTAAYNNFDVAYPIYFFGIQVFTVIQQIGFDYFYIILSSSIALWVLMYSCSYLTSVLQEIYLQNVNNNLRDIFIKNLNDKNFDFIKVNNSAVAHNWINNDILNIYSKGSSVVLNLISLSFTFIFSLISLFLLFWGIGLLVLVIALISVFVPIFFNQKLESIGNKFGEDNERYFVNTYKNLKGIRNLFLLGRLDIVANNIKQDTLEYKKNKIEFIYKQYKILWALIMLAILGQLLAITMGAVFSALGFMSASSLFSIAFLTGSVFGTFQGLFQGIMNLSVGKALIKKNIFPSQKNEYSINENLEPLNYLELKNVSLEYKDKKILNNINYKFEANKKYLITGVSGCGKSTMVQILLGINYDHTGKSLWNKKEIKKINHKLINQNVSYVTNDGYIFEDNVLNNICLFDDSIDQKQLDLSIKNSNLNFIDDVNKKINKSKLSTGQIQRINIARSFYQNKKIVIFDEALSNLDEQNAFNIEKILLEQKDLTFIHITHHINDKNKKLYDKVLLVKDGGISNV
ncbi:ABC transporter ATP-binding protein [Malacoplasma penetrans]|nr:ABC transporter ATP-binding protein [Malacoplasma penetrans]